MAKTLLIILSILILLFIIIYINLSKIEFNKIYKRNNILRILFENQNIYNKYNTGFILSPFGFPLNNNICFLKVTILYK